MYFDWITWSIWCIGLVIMIVWIVVPLREFKRLMASKKQQRP